MFHHKKDYGPQLSAAARDGDLASLRRLLDKRSARRQINVRVVGVIVVRECECVLFGGGGWGCMCGSDAP